MLHSINQPAAAPSYIVALPAQRPQRRFSGTAHGALGSPFSFTVETAALRLPPTPPPPHGRGGRGGRAPRPTRKAASFLPAGPFKNLPPPDRREPSKFSSIYWLGMQRVVRHLSGGGGGSGAACSHRGQRFGRKQCRPLWELCCFYIQRGSFHFLLAQEASRLDRACV